MTEYWREGLADMSPVCVCGDIGAPRQRLCAGCGRPFGGMKHAWNRSRTFRGDSGGMYEASDVGELDQAMLARLGAQCTGAADIDVVDHVLNVARVVTAARVRTANDRGRRRTLGQVLAPTASEGDRS